MVKMVYGQSPLEYPDIHYRLMDEIFVSKTTERVLSNQQSNVNTCLSVGRSDRSSDGFLFVAVEDGIPIG
jgi:hypothetical protein